MFFLPSLILAAGSSQRMGCPKLSLPFGAGLLVSPVLELATAVSGKDGVFVVLRPEAEGALVNEIRQRGLRTVTAAHAAEGQSASLKAGVAAVEEAIATGGMPETMGVLVFLADQPGLQKETVLAVLGEFDGENVVAAAYEGRRGHPVILPRRAFSAVMELTGDKGARELLQAFGLRAVPSSDRAVLQDVDTPEAYAACVAEWKTVKDQQQ